MLKRFIISAYHYITVRVYRNLASVGIYLKKNTDDRQVLENTIFPYFRAHKEYLSILFIGCAWFTKRYNQLFNHKVYWTVDIDPKMKKFGSKRHIVDSMENLDRYFKESELDVIFCNGVYGWGLNTKEDVEKAFKNCFNLLREGGIFILGWNDIPERRPYSLDEFEILRLFQPFHFEPLNTTKYLTKNPNQHTFSFYMKPINIEPKRTYSGDEVSH